MKQFTLENGDVVTIREATLEDAEDIINYIDQVASESHYLTFGQGELKIKVDQERQFIENCKKSDNSLMIVAEVNGKIIGNLSFSGGKNSRIYHMGEFGVTVLKEFWKLGIGRKLIEYMIEWASNGKQIRKINLKVREDNLHAIRLYEKMGFKKEGVTTRFFYHNGVFYSAVLMGLEID